MSDALVKIMNLPCAGFDGDGEETVNREAAAEIVRELDAQIARMRVEYADLREQIATLCERLPYGTGLAGKTYAEAIRRIGYGGQLAAQYYQTLDTQAEAK